MAFPNGLYIQQAAPLLNLPRELRDQVYEHIFPRDNTYRVETPRDLERRCPLLRLSVCRQFYFEAKQTFYRATTLQVRFPCHVGRLAKTSSGREVLSQIIFLSLDWDTGAHDPDPNLKAITLCTSPKYLEITTLDYYGSFDTADKDADYMDLDDADFEQVKGIKDVRQLRGLQSLHIVNRAPATVDYHGDRAKWKENVDRLEDYVRSAVMQPRQSDYGTRARRLVLEYERDEVVTMVPKTGIMMVVKAMVMIVLLAVVMMLLEAAGVLA